jgi:hypothetical protein
MTTEPINGMTTEPINGMATEPISDTATEPLSGTATEPLRGRDGWRNLAAAQGGVVGRQQLRMLGISRSFVRVQLRARRWQRPLPRTFVTFTGPMSFATRAWAALVYAGPESMLSHGAAAYLAGLVDAPPDVIDVTVPHGHKVVRRSGVRPRQSRLYADKRHPTRTPPTTRLEDTVLDLTDVASTEVAVVDVVLSACQRRLTTAARILLAGRNRKRLRWRALIAALLSDVRSGVRSALEREYLIRVERAHGLPRGTRNRAEGEAGHRRYRDVRYGKWRGVVELDGEAAHPREKRELDDLRDNELVLAEGTRTLRYGWRSVVGSPCLVAAQVAQLLRSNGWPGVLRRCGPDCTAV